jgi:hypothetical protein
MRNWFSRLMLAFLLVFTSDAFAQDYSLVLIPAPGAGQSNGDSYSLEGRIAVFYPHRSSGGDFILETGLFDSPEPVLPGDIALLTSYSDGRLTILWDRAAANYLLEATPALSSGAEWNALNLPTEANATHFFVSVPVSSQQQFFRLRRR